MAVKLELPSHTVILHLGTGLGLLATLFLVGMRAGVADGSVSAPASLVRGRGGIVGALALGTLVVLMGGMTATTGAFSSCLGFPLCNGQIWPAGGEGGLQHIHWTHRLLAYALFLHLIGVVIGLRRKGAPGRVLGSAWLVLALGIIHKLRVPSVPLRFAARSAKDLVVFRAPAYATNGIVRAKHFDAYCNVPQIMGDEGFVEERLIPGVRGEAAQYWRRR